VLRQTSVAALMQSRVSAHVGVTGSLHDAARSNAVIPVYNTSTRPRMHLMSAASGTSQLSANVARPRVALHSAQMAERCDKLYDSVDTATRMASIRAQVWQQQSNQLQSNQFGAHQESSQLELQPMPAYMMAQKRHVQAPVSGCGTIPEWSRFSGQMPYQQSERLPQQQQQQRHMVPTGPMIRHQLPTYQNVIDQRLHQDMMIKRTWQQQQQRHLMHFQSLSHHHSSIAGVVSEPCDIGGFRQAASSSCIYTATVSTVSSAV